MSTIRTGPQPSQSIQAAGAQVASQQAGTSQPMPSGPTAELRPRENLVQTAGASGRAAPVELVKTTSVYSEQIRRLLVQNKFEDIAKVISQASPQALQGLELSSSEITKIAEGLGQGSWYQSLPLVGSYKDDQKQVIEKLVMASDISLNAKVSNLKELVGLDAVLSLVRSASVTELKQLSNANRHMAIAVLDPGNSIWGSIKSASSELVSRRIIGNRETEADQIASKILRSVPAGRQQEAQIKGLLASANNFNRDDITYRYVMDLQPAELLALSDEMKRHLMSQLLDTDIMGLDLNKIGNLDEFFNMTFKEHASAALLLFKSMQPEAQQSEAVQTLVKKSDELMRQVQALEQSLKQDLASGQLNREKMGEYQQQLQSLKSEYADQPELKAKVTELLQNLSTLQGQLDVAERVQAETQNRLSALPEQIKQAQAHLEQVEASLKPYLEALDQSKESLSQAETQLKAKYQELLNLHSQLQGPDNELVQQMQSVLNRSTPLSETESQLRQLTQQLTALEQNVNRQGLDIEAIQARISETNADLALHRNTYNTASKAFETQQQELQSDKQVLDGLMANYRQQVQTLATGLAQVETKWQAVSDNPFLKDSDRQMLQTSVTEASKEVNEHRAAQQNLSQQYQQALEPLGQLETSLTQQQSRAASIPAAEQEIGFIQSATNFVGEKVNAAYDYVAEKVKSALNLVTGTLTGARQDLAQAKSAEDLAAIELNIQSKINEINTYGDKVLSNSDLQSNLNELKQLQQQIQKTKEKLDATKDLKSTLDSAQSDFEKKAGSLASTIQNATSAAEATKTEIINRWTSNIQAVNQKLDETKTAVDNYAGNIASFQADLQSNRDAKTKLKEEYEAKLLGQHQPEALNKFRQAMSQLDAQQVEIERQLQASQGQLTKLNQEMQSQTKLLQGYQTSLNKELSALDHAGADVKLQLEGLEAQHTENLETFKQNQDLIDELQQMMSPDNPLSPVIQQELARLTQMQSSLKQVIDETQALLHDKSSFDQIDQIRHALKASVAQTQSTLSTGLSRIEDFKTGPLKTTETRMSEIREQFDTIHQNSVASRQALNQLFAELEQAAQTQTGGLTQTQIGAKIAAAFRDIQNIGDLEHLQIRGGFELSGRIQEAIGRANDTIATNQRQTQQTTAELDAADATINTIRANVSGVQGQIGQLEQEAQAHQQALLSSQRELLSQRRNIGINSQAYQESLTRMDFLLSMGRPLSAQEQQEFRQLEANLAQIESSLLQTAGELQERVTALNVFKSRINQNINILNSSLAQLSVLARDLITKSPALESSQQDLQTHKQVLNGLRAEVMSEIQRLRNDFMLAGSEDGQNTLRQLEADLAYLDAKISEVQQNIDENSSVLQRIDRTKERIDTDIEQIIGLLGQLQLLQGKVEDLLGEANRQLKEAQDLLGLTTQLKNEVTTVAQEAETLNVAAPASGGLQPTSQASSQGVPSVETEVSNRKEALQKESFSRQLSNRLTSFWSGQRRSSEQKIEADHQAQRQAFHHDLEQRLDLARQYNTDLKAQVAEQAQLEQITDHLIEQIQQGQRANSGLNLV